MAWSLPNELNGDEKKSEQVMRFVTYGATPGLEQFPKGERKTLKLTEIKEARLAVTW